jgi:ABC-2 type transport system permease protein
VTAVIARRALAERARQLAGYVVGLVALVATMASVWPTLRDNDEMQQLLDEYPKAVIALFGGTGALDFTTAAGFLQVELMGFVAPLVVLLFGIAFGAGTLAGDEEHGLSELVLASGISRWRVYLEKAAAVAIGVAVVAAAFSASLAAASVATGMDLSAAGIAGAGLALCVLGWVFALLALAVGGATGSRATAIGVPAVAAVAAYLVANLAELAQWLEPLRPWSPVYQTVGREPLADGVPWLPLAAFTGVAVAVAAVGAWRYDRRDLHG